MVMGAGIWAEMWEDMEEATSVDMEAVILGGMGAGTDILAMRMPAMERRVKAARAVSFGLCRFSIITPL